MELIYNIINPVRLNLKNPSHKLGFLYLYLYKTNTSFMKEPNRVRKNEIKAINVLQLNEEQKEAKNLLSRIK